MNIETVFGIDYISSGKHYVKISVILENHGVFAVIYNRDTNKIQCQKYPDYPVMHKVTHGERGSVHCGYERLKMKSISLTENDKKGLSECAYNLTSAFRKYLEIKPILDFDERKEISKEIYRINKLIRELCKNEPVITSEKPVTSEKVDEWIDCGTDDDIKNDLNEIICKINSNHNPIDGVEFNGNKYRFTNREGNIVFQKKNDNSESVIKKTRDTIQMVKMINAEGLTNVVVNGNFYPIVRTNEYNGKHFVTINVNNNEITVLQDRVKLVNVFTDILEK